MNWWRALLCWLFGLIVVEFRLDCDKGNIHEHEFHLFPHDLPTTEVTRLCKAFGRQKVYVNNLYFGESSLSWWIHPREQGKEPFLYEEIY